jgi:hypothetical protein
MLPGHPWLCLWCTLKKQKPHPKP